MSGDLHDVPFRFHLSDRTLFSLRRRLLVQTFGIDNAALADLPLTVPSQDLASNCDGLLMRSLPLREARPGVHNLSARSDGLRLLCYVLQCFPRYYIDMAQSFEEYKQKFSAKTRSTLARKVKKFAEHCNGRIRWQVFQRAEEMDDFMRLARRVSAKTYQERLLDAGLPTDAEFVAEARQLAARDELRAYLLFDGDRPVSYLFCPVREGVIIYAYLGYDPEYVSFSVGTVLQWLALESLFKEGRFRYFDFTEGESEQKRLFSTGHLECANVVFLRMTLANYLMVHAHRAFERFIEAVGHWLEKHDLKIRVKRWLRFGRAAS